MRIFGILVLIGVLGMPLVATAEESAQQPSQEQRTRSMARDVGRGGDDRWRGNSGGDSTAEGVCGRFRAIGRFCWMRNYVV